LLAIEKRAKILDRKRYKRPPCLLHLSCDLVLWLQVAAAHVSQRARHNAHLIGPGSHSHCCSMRQCVVDTALFRRYISFIILFVETVDCFSCFVNDAGQKQKRQLLQKLLTLVQTWRPTWRKLNGLCCPAALRWRLLGAALLILPSSVGASRKQCACWTASRSVLVTFDMSVCVSTVLLAGKFLKQSCHDWSSAYVMCCNA
jgi:hypothetical protein